MHDRTNVDHGVRKTPGPFDTRGFPSLQSLAVPEAKHIHKGGRERNFFTTVHS